MSIKSQRKKRIKAEKQAAAQAARLKENWLQKVDRESKVDYLSVREVLESPDGAMAFFYNDGECAIAFIGQNDENEPGENSLQYFFRDKLNATWTESDSLRWTRAAFRAMFPLNQSIVDMMPADKVRVMRDMVYIENNCRLPEKAPTTVPHYTRESVLEIFKRGTDDRLVKNMFGTEWSLEMWQEPGYFVYDEKDGKGIVTFYVHEDEEEEHPIFTADCEITDEIRNATCDNPECKCAAPWNTITWACGCGNHHKGERYWVLPRFEVCTPKECDGTHVHLYGFCEVCFAIDLANGKKRQGISADHIHIAVTDGAPATVAA